MARFLFIYRSLPEDHADISPEEMQAIMQKWNEWIKSGFESGWLAEAGDALKPEGRVVNAQQVVSDGPFAESKELVGGYSIIEAEDVDAALVHAKACPMLLSESGSVEIRELAEIEIESS